MFRGTLNELAGKISMNGKTALTYNQLHHLAVIGEGIFSTRIGVRKNSGGRGKPPVIWEFKTNPRFRFETFEGTLAPESVEASGGTTAADVAAEGSTVEASGDTTVEASVDAGSAFSSEPAENSSNASENDAEVSSETVDDTVLA